MSEKRPTKYERELLADLEQCRLERDQFRDGRNFLWKERGKLARELDRYQSKGRSHDAA